MIRSMEEYAEHSEIGADWRRGGASFLGGFIRSANEGGRARRVSLAAGRPSVLLRIFPCLLYGGWRWGCLTRSAGV